MATVTKRTKKDGSTAYLIKASSGFNVDGKRIRPSITWKPEKGWTEKKIEKELERQIVLFEESIKHGENPHDGSIKFQAFAELFLSDYADSKLKYKTVENYTKRLKQIYPAIGHIRLRDLKTGHLNALYKQLQDVYVQTGTKYIAKIDIMAKIRIRKLSKTSFSKAAGISKATLNAAVDRKRIAESSATAICAQLDMKISSVFNAHTPDVKLSVSSIHTIHRIISAVLSRAVKWGYIMYNPAINTERPKMETKKAAYLDIEDARLLLSLLHDEPIKYRAMISLDLLTGLRRGEFLGLRWCDIDFDNEVITVAQTSNYVKARGVYVDTPKSEKSIRQLKVARSAFILLREYKAWQDDQREKCGDYWKQTDNRIFTGDDGSVIHPDTPTKWFKSFIRRHGFPDDVHVHSLRHTYASITVADGTPLAVVSNNLGHAQESTTRNIYSHVIKSSAAKAAESVNDKFADVVESPPLQKEKAAV